jgi:hypothetical protein
MKSTLLMRMHGMEQEVCQLFLSTLCRKIDSKRQWVAVLAAKVAISFRFDLVLKLEQALNGKSNAKTGC